MQKISLLRQFEVSIKHCLNFPENNTFYAPPPSLKKQVFKNCLNFKVGNNNMTLTQLNQMILQPAQNIIPSQPQVLYFIPPPSSSTCTEYNTLPTPGTLLIPPLLLLHPVQNIIPSQPQVLYFILHRI